MRVLRHLECNSVRLSVVIDEDDAILHSRVFLAQLKTEKINSEHILLYCVEIFCVLVPRKGFPRARQVTLVGRAERKRACCDARSTSTTCLHFRRSGLRRCAMTRGSLPTPTCSWRTTLCWVTSAVRKDNPAGAVTSNSHSCFAVRTLSGVSDFSRLPDRRQTPADATCAPARLTSPYNVAVAPGRLRPAVEPISSLKRRCDVTEERCDSRRDAASIVSRLPNEETQH